MKVITIITFIFFHLTLFGQVNDTDAFFTGDYDKSFIQQHKIKQVSAQGYVDGDKISLHIFDFNETGSLLTQRIFDKNGKIVNEYLFGYNKEGDQIQRITFNQELDVTDTVAFTKIYEAGHLVQQTSGDLPFVTRHTYNPKGEKIQSTTYLEMDTSISPKRIFSYTYDTSGKLKSIQETYGAGSGSTPVIIGHTEYIYDNANNTTSILREGKANYSFTYYEDGLLKEKMIKMPENLGGLIIVDKFSYKFW